MEKFIDAKNRAWMPEINVITIGRVRKALDVNILELLHPDNTLSDRANDPCFLVDVLYLLCKDAADEANVDDVDFGKAMTPEAMEDGWKAVLQGLVSFSQRGLRPAYQKVLDKAIAVQKAEEKRIKKLTESPEFDKMIDREIETLRGRRTNTPSESTSDALSLPESLESNRDDALSPS